jgi:hypothetical protein
MADEDALKGQDQELVREVDTESQESADVKPSEAPLAIVGIGASTPRSGTTQPFARDPSTFHEDASGINR